MARRKPARRSARPRPGSRRAPARRRAAKPARRKRALKTAAKTRKPARKGRGVVRAKAPVRKAAGATARRQKPKTAPARRLPTAQASSPKPAVRPKKPAPAPKLVKAVAPHPAALDRERRRLPDDERGSTATEGDARAFAAARTGNSEIVAAIERHHETSPAMTAGDVDAKWEDAYAIGDETPGGDNPTPDQDRVDDIGHALGLTYDDNEELRPNDKIADRDAHRWELDPASSDDWPHDK